VCMCVYFAALLAVVTNGHNLLIIIINKLKDGCVRAPWLWPRT
jgi:hypothetical protein